MSERGKIPQVGAIYRGSVPDTDPMYRRGWSVVSGSSTERPSIKDLIPPDWTIVPAKPGRTVKRQKIGGHL